MTRKVRFAETPEYHDLPSRSSPTPKSFTRTVESPMRVFPFTLPPSTSSTSSSTSSAESSIKLHGILGFHNPLPFNFDISVDPSINPHLTKNNLLTAALNDPATHPPMPEFIILNRHLPWGITILASNGKYVTVSDVLGGLYRALRFSVSEKEFYQESEQKRDAITAAFNQRCEMRQHYGEAAANAEHSRGVKRIDFLGGLHQFCGLSKTGHGNVWKLSVQ